MREMPICARVWVCVRMPVRLCARALGEELCTPRVFLWG